MGCHKDLLWKHRALGRNRPSCPTKHAVYHCRQPSLNSAGELWEKVCTIAHTCPTWAVKNLLTHTECLCFLFAMFLWVGPKFKLSVVMSSLITLTLHPGPAWVLEGALGLHTLVLCWVRVSVLYVTGKEMCPDPCRQKILYIHSGRYYLPNRKFIFLSVYEYQDLIIRFRKWKHFLILTYNLMGKEMLLQQLYYSSVHQPLLFNQKSLRSQFFCAPALRNWDSYGGLTV